MSGTLGGLPELNLTTIGAKSGLARSVPLVYVRDEANPGSFALIGSNWGQKHYPAWYFNLKANPQATAVIDGKKGEYVAREVSGAEYERFWQKAMSLYVGYRNYKERIHGGRNIPIVVLSPKKG
jgi:deazaflavin-dependent oxidoreductase (nitroreductase family)